MNTKISTFEDRIIRPALLDEVAFVRAPNGKLGPRTTLRAALIEDALEGATIEGLWKDSPYALCYDGAPGVWYIPIQWTARP